MVRTLLFWMLVTVGLSVPAVAEEDTIPQSALTGLWSFTADTQDGCSFTGTMLLSEGEETDVFGCELIATQDCPAVRWVVQQSCVARLTGRQLTVRSEIEQFLEGEDVGLYLPDNFSVRVVDATLMTGALISYGISSAIFTRPDGAIS